MNRRSLTLTLLISVSSFSTHAAGDWDLTPTVSEPTGLSNAIELIKAEKYSEALPLLSTLAEAQPGNANVFNLLGYTRRNLGDLERSGLDYARALRLDPHHRGALEYQGELFLKLGNVEKAKRNLARLETICGSECSETEELAEAISAWQEQKSH